MFESLLLSAFTVGLISAVSLPLGAATTFFWHPSDRAVAMLMAFGGGALLAALTIDLVGSALEQGHFHALALGAVLGGLLFVGLNRVVNDYGGFLRKVSTTVYHLRRKQHQRLQRIARQLRRVDLFAELPAEDFRALAAAIRAMDFDGRRWLYQPGDPPDGLYIVLDGEVDLFDPHDRSRAPERLGRFDVFGWRAVLAATPFGHGARTRGRVSLWLVPASAIQTLLRDSRAFRSKVGQLLSGPDMLTYLQREHGLDTGPAQDWLQRAADSLAARQGIPSAIPVQRNTETFQARLAHMQHILLTRDLSPRAQELIGTRLIYKCHPRGTSFYHQYETADRMFIIEQGEVELFDANAPTTEPEVLRDCDAFGDLAMLTGAPHSVTAVAATDTAVWELRKRDFDELLELLPELRDHVRAYVERAGAGGYLVERQHIDADNTARWMRQALRNVDAGRPVPAAAELRRQITENRGAPLAIWLGITLDGIPESLVIGASMIEAQLGIALIVGLFLSNFPEALSSSMGMRRQGMSKRRVLLMWSSLMLFTGIGAALGSRFFVGAAPEAFALVQGLAAGAMLTMIAETMLPEAYFKGGSVVGMSTLAGFLVAIFAKTLE